MKVNNYLIKYHKISGKLWHLMSHRGTYESALNVARKCTENLGNNSVAYGYEGTCITNQNDWIFMIKKREGKKRLK